MTATTARKSAAKKAGPKPAAGFDQGDELAQYAVQLIAIADIDTGANPRTYMDETDIADLAESITQTGLQTPIRVEETGDQPPYRLVFGGRRIEAFRRLGREFIPATVRPAGEPARTAAARLVENLQRADLSPLDEARALHELVELGLKQSDVAIMIGRNQGHVSKRLALLKLIERGHTLLSSGQLPLEHAVDVAKLPAAVQSSVLGNIATGMNPGSAVRHARDQIAKLRERGDVIKRLQKAGTPVIDRAVDKGIIPEDAREFRGSDAEWEADPNRLAVVRTSDHSWGHGIERWVDRYTTGPASEQPADQQQGLLSRRDPTGPAHDPTGPAHDPAGEEDDQQAAWQAQAEERRQAANAAEEARARRQGELRDFIRTLISGKISPTWERFLVRLSLITAVAGDPDELDGCPAAVSSAGEVLELPVNADLDLQGFETLTAVLGLLESDDAPGTLLRLALGARLFNGLRFLQRYGVQEVVGAEVLAFLHSEGLTLTEAETKLVEGRHWAMEGVCVEYELVQGRPDPEEPGETEDDIAALAEAEHPVTEVELPEVDEATGEPDRDDADFDAPVETFRPDRAAEAAKPTQAEIEALTRPNLIKLAEEHKVETTPRMTRLQLVALLTRALVDPADEVS